MSTGTHACHEVGRHALKVHQRARQDTEGKELVAERALAHRKLGCVCPVEAVDLARRQECRFS